MIFILNVFAGGVLFAQNNASVYMLNGEVYRGEIIALGSEFMLIKYDDQIFSLDRNKVRYVFGPEKKLKVGRKTHKSCVLKHSQKKRWLSNCELE